MEDGAPVHRVKLANEWKVSHVITQMDCPAQSPDLNPLEKCVEDLKREGALD